ncbi:SAM-dependent methyltransferase [Maribacter sp. 2307ULW6-5]|uniref:SAM-dependent methyltransferase n=1 Tax=Maribacter sp. 2307ULW6-5 TaxID=3386275 RepID=UPI0039BD5FA7
MEKPPKGHLYLIPTTLGDNEPLEVLPMSVKQSIEKIDHYIVENEKTARHFIKKIHPRKSQPNLTLFLLNKFTEAAELPSFLQPCMQGVDVGILSEAGCPGIADPGASVVAMAHEKGIRAIPLVGPSSILMGVMASGLNGQNFAFNGYLPIDAQERKQKLKLLEKRSKEEQQTQVFIETPYRNNKFLESMLRHLGPHTRICIASDISLSSEFIATKTVSQWKQEKVDLHKRPTIFMLLA